MCNAAFAFFTLFFDYGGDTRPLSSFFVGIAILILIPKLCFVLSFRGRR
jgi:hypothetical protein